VRVIAREETASVIQERGIEVQSVRLGGFSAHPAAYARLTEPVEILVIATKATTLLPALDRVQYDPGLVVPLLNGLDHLEVLRDRFGPGSVPAGTIRIESARASPGHIVQSSPFLRIDLAADDAALRARLDAARATFEHADIPCRVERSEAHVLWTKLVRLNALACTTSAAERRLGFIRSDPGWRAVLEACVFEATEVANAEGADMDPGVPLGELEDAHAELNSSMARDIAAGREPELDAIAGAVLRASARHGLTCPTIARLAAAIAERAGIDPPRV